MILFKENIFIFNQKIFAFKKFYLQRGFFSYEKYIFIQSKKILCNEIFLFNRFRYSNQVFYDLHSDFDALVSHKNKLRLTVSPIRFVFCLKKQVVVLYLAASVTLNRDNLSFFPDAYIRNHHKIDHFFTIGCRIANDLTPEADL